MAIPDLLITNLENTGNLHVATLERMHDLPEQMGKEDVEVIDEDLGFELCQREGIEAIVLGSFIKAGDMFATNIKVLNTENKRIMKSASSRGEGVDSILRTQIDDLSREISEGIGIPDQRIEASPIRIVEFTTDSMEAYSNFLKGRESQDKMYDDEARKFLEKAVILDPEFAYAYLLLGRAYSGLGLDKERFVIITGINFPIFHDILARAYREKGEFDKAIAEYERLITIDPEGGDQRLIHPKYHYRLAKLYEQKGWEGKAIEHYEKFLELWKNADPGVEEVRDARKRLEGLRIP